MLERLDHAQLPRFETEPRQALLAAQPDGVFAEEVAVRASGLWEHRG